MRDLLEGLRGEVGRHDRLLVFLCPFAWALIAYPKFIELMLLRYGSD